MRIPRKLLITAGSFFIKYKNLWEKHRKYLWIRLFLGLLVGASSHSFLFLTLSWIVSGHSNLLFIFYKWSMEQRDFDFSILVIKETSLVFYWLSTGGVLQFDEFISPTKLSEKMNATTNFISSQNKNAWFFRVAPGSAVSNEPPTPVAPIWASKADYTVPSPAIVVQR